MNYRDKYNEKFERIIKYNNLVYIVVECKNICGLERFRYLIKKSIRDYCKLYDINKSSEYCKYLINIEINSAISKGDIWINDMGYHAHIIISNYQYMNCEKYKEIVCDMFLKADIYIGEIYDLDGLRGYHLKQSCWLNEDFIVTNLK